MKKASLFRKMFKMRRKSALNAPKGIIWTDKINAANCLKTALKQIPQEVVQGAPKAMN